MSSLSIEIEDMNTWPQNFLKIAIENKAMIVSYHQESKRIDKLCRENVEMRWNTPVNIYTESYAKIVQDLDKILKQHSIIGYHCTRLFDYEINSIKSDGMRLLSSELIKNRLTYARNNNYLLQQEFDYLINSNKIQTNLNNESNRTGKIWFCPNRSILKKEYNGIYPFFCYWGGEAVYHGHKNDNNISDTLRKIGTPSIVKCAMPFSDVQQFHSSYAERFLSYLILDIIDYPDPPAEFDMYIERDLLSSEVLEIIEISNPVFEHLTDYNNWNEYYTIT